MTNEERRNPVMAKLKRRNVAHKKHIKQLEICLMRWKVRVANLEAENEALRAASTLRLKEVVGR